MSTTAPYNFVPFYGKALRRYDSPKEVPSQDLMDPDLYSGVIRYELTAETPVMVSEGMKIKGAPLQFTHRNDGIYFIPGSTVKGMIRQNMHILGKGLVRPGEDMQERTMQYRQVGGKTQGGEGALRDYYKTVLDVKTREGISIPERVEYGYIYAVEGNKYEILPVKNMYRISRDHPDVKAIFDRQSDDKERNAVTFEVYFRPGGGKANSVRLANGSAIIPGEEKGILLVTGRSVGKPNSLYVFPAMDPGAEPVPVSDEDILNYRLDFEARRNSLKAYYHPEFWELPKLNETAKAVFFIRYNGHIFISRSRYPRVGYKYALSEGLPAGHRGVEGPESFMDYPRAMLGYADVSGSALRSRVFFGDMTAPKGTRAGATTELILAEPKPSFYRGYVTDGKTYNDEGFELRGYKLYWLKDITRSVEGKDSQKTKINPLPVGTVFSGEVRFNNLHKDELGLLLWCLKLNDGCFQSLGMGKPYGYGRVKPIIKELSLTNAQMYTAAGFETPFEAAVPDEVASLISEYKDYAGKQLGENNIDSGFVKLFLNMRRFIVKPSEAAYMPLDGFKDADPLGKAAELLKPYIDEEKQKKKQEQKTEAAQQEAAPAGMTDAQVCEAILSELRKLDKNAAKQCSCTLTGQTLVIKHPSPFLITRYRPKLQKALQDIKGKEYTLQIK